MRMSAPAAVRRPLGWVVAAACREARLSILGRD